MIALSNQEKWRPWGAFALEAIVLVLEIWLFAPLQANLGRTGLIITELAFLALAVGTALLHKTSLKEVFPLKRPTLRELGGVLLLCLSGLMLSVFATHVSLILLPQSMPEIKELHDFLYTGQSLPVMVLIVAIMPAICEEALQRGAILSHLRSLKKDWLIILIMGIFFGLFHLSALRFLSTAILGALLSYLIVKKNNLVLPMLMHHEQPCQRYGRYHGKRERRTGPGHDANHHPAAAYRRQLHRLLPGSRTSGSSWEPHRPDGAPPQKLAGRRPLRRGTVYGRYGVRVSLHVELWQSRRAPGKLCL